MPPEIIPTTHAKLDLILRGLHLVIRTSYHPNEQAARMKHFVALQQDIGGWLTDYADVMQSPQGESS